MAWDHPGLPQRGRSLLVPQSQPASGRVRLERVAEDRGVGRRSTGAERREDAADRRTTARRVHRMSTLRHDWTASNQTECYRCGTAWRPEVDNEQCSGWKAPPPPPLTFERLRAVNVLRCEDAFHKLNAWLPEQWTNAMAGETGEACNITKKMGRGDYPDEYSMADATRELA